MTSNMGAVSQGASDEGLPAPLKEMAGEDKKPDDGCGQRGDQDRRRRDIFDELHTVMSRRVKEIEHFLDHGIQ